MAFVPKYILILGITIIIDYIAGIYIEKTEDKKLRKIYLIISIFFNVIFLVFFKYFNFFNENLTNITNIFNVENPVPYLNIILPIGLSFHTFQAMSYTIEVYRGNQKAEKHFGIYALYVMFYPQLVAGPIERPQNVLHQFHEKHNFSSENLIRGLRLILWGMFKKVVIADRLAIYVNQVYNHPNQHEGLPVILATYFFAFQIYCDFSGYSDIALGSARVMGFNLMENFKAPYLATNISDFWRRWHISLSTWFRDYVYIPLGGSKGGKFSTYRNLFIIFLISGFWHGASWNFVIWGALHGIFLVIYNYLRDINLLNFKLTTIISALITFNFVSFAWIFFRAKTLSDALIIINNIIKFNNFNYLVIDSSLLFLFTLFLIILLIFVDFILSNEKLKNTIFSEKYSVLRWIIYYIMIFMIFQFGVYHSSEEFIYFQF